MKIVKPDRSPAPSNSPAKKRPNVREVSTGLPPEDPIPVEQPAAITGEVSPSFINRQSDAPVPPEASPDSQPRKRQTKNLDKLEYSIPYEPLGGGKILDLPHRLNYKPIDGFMVSKLNELNMDNIDEGLNQVLDQLCYESSYQEFTHWMMPTNEKIRAFLNLRLNSVGPVIEHLFGVCLDCGESKLFTKVEITSFNETFLKDNYQEPFPLKTKVKGDLVRFKARILQSGDIFKAKQIWQKNKNFVYQQFPDATENDEEAVVQLLEYANSILEVDGKPPTFESALEFCRKVEIMNAISGFNDYFSYGMSLETEGLCNNDECASVVSAEATFNAKEEKKGGKKRHRRSQFRFPFQPNIFDISFTEEKTIEQHFDLEQDPGAD